MIDRRAGITAGAAAWGLAVLSVSLAGTTAVLAVINRG